MTTPTTDTVYWTLKGLIQAYLIKTLTEHFTKLGDSNPGVHARRVVTTPGNGLEEWFRRLAANYDTQDDWTVYVKMGALIPAVETKARVLGAEPGKLEENRWFTEQLSAVLGRGQTHREVVAAIVTHTEALLDRLAPHADELLIKTFLTELVQELDELRHGSTPEDLIAIYHSYLNYLLATLGVPREQLPKAAIQHLDTFIWNVLKPYQV